jgi:hypothetical protein
MSTPSTGTAVLVTGVVVLLWSAAAYAQDAGVQLDAAPTDAEVEANDGDLLHEADGDVEAEPEAPPIPPERLPRVEARLEADEVELGQTVTMSVEVTYRPGDRVHLREQRSLEHVEILSSAREMPEEGAEGPSEVLRLELICFEVGDIEIPTLDLMVVLSDGRTGTVTTPPLSLRVTDPLANENDPQPRGEHPPRTVYTTDRRAIWTGAFLGGMLLAVLLGLGIERWRSTRKPKPGPPPPPPRPPEEVALEKLRAIEESELLEEGEVKSFHVAISEAIREYLGGRYGFDSLEMTTKEIILQLDAALLRGITRAELQEFLRETDMVKFAKWLPPEERSHELLEHAFNIVRRTTAAERAAGAIVQAPPVSVTRGRGPDEPSRGASAGGADGT